MTDRLPSWALPLVVLAAISLAVSASISALTGGLDIADDAPRLLYLVRHPFALWSSYEQTGLGPLWGSFPPLLPPLFGLLVRPFSWVAPDFWAIRLGTLCWTGVIGVVLYRLLRDLEGVPERESRQALWLFALLPSVWAGTSALPEEEIYVAGYVLLLYAAARTGRWGWVPALLVLTALAGKYFALIVLLPLAFASPSPWRNAALWGALLVATLGAYVGYHQLRFGVAPILSYQLPPTSSISVWALLWNLGWQPPVRIVGPAGVVVTGLVSLGMSWLARRHGVPLRHSLAVTLYVALLFVATTFPPYVLWAVPLVLCCWVRMSSERQRVWLVVGMLAWSAGEWGQNFFRGVYLALRVERSEGKEIIAALTEAALGADFPYHAVHVAFLALTIASGLALLALLWNAGRDEARRATR